MKNKKPIGIYYKLFERYGPQHWWPGGSPFEVMVGAILTQSTTWKNVEKSISNLKKARVMTPSALRRISVGELAELVYPSGYYNAKSAKLKALVDWLSDTCEDNLDELFARDINVLRRQLLSVHGIGPETADSVLLYAANRPVFVIDAYTRRIAGRIGLSPKDDTYEAYQGLFMENLPRETQLFNEYHALLVHLGKDVCRKRPLCEKCCLFEICCYNEK